MNKKPTTTPKKTENVFSFDEAKQTACFIRPALTISIASRTTTKAGKTKTTYTADVVIRSIKDIAIGHTAQGKQTPADVAQEVQALILAREYQRANTRANALEIKKQDGATLTPQEEAERDGIPAYKQAIEKQAQAIGADLAKVRSIDTTARPIALFLTTLLGDFLPATNTRAFCAKLDEVAGINRASLQELYAGKSVKLTEAEQATITACKQELKALMQPFAGTFALKVSNADIIRFYESYGAGYDKHGTMQALTATKGKDDKKQDTKTLHVMLAHYVLNKMKAGEQAQA